MTKEKLKTSWHKLTTLRLIQEHFSGDELMTPTEFGMLCFIAHQDGRATLTMLINHPYFKNVSISTMKRTAISLTKRGLITSVDGSNDRRERLLSVVEVPDG